MADALISDAMKTKSPKGMRMWPSLETAVRVSDWANIGLIGSLAVVAVCTGLVVWMANVKEEYWDIERDAASGRIVELVTEAELAKAGIANAQSNAASANERTAAAAVELEREKVARAQFEAQFSWRLIDESMRRKIIDGLKSAPHVVAIEFPSGDQEATFLAFQFANVMQEAGWDPILRSVPAPPMLIWGIVVPEAANETAEILRHAVASATGTPVNATDSPVPGLFMGGGVGPPPECRLIIGVKPTDAVMKMVVELNARISPKQ